MNPAASFFVPQGAVNLSPLQAALEWWGLHDDLGGFRSAGAILFPGWVPRRSCRAPHREDRTPSFSLYRNARGDWRFKDHATGEQGGLVAFVMLAGMGGGTAARWLMEGAGRNGETRNAREVSLRHSGFAIDSSSGIRHSSFSPWQPYAMSDCELSRCAAMSSALASGATAIHAIASARGWQYRTLRALAHEGSLGIHEGLPVMIYPTGAKKRFKPLDPSAAQSHRGPKFAWLFGKPHSLWRGDRIGKATERVHITEGETDAITLIDAGCDDGLREIVMAVPGASCWRDEWAPAFRGLRVTLWPDPDEAGARLTERMVATLSPHARQIDIAEKNTTNTGTKS